MRDFTGNEHVSSCTCKEKELSPSRTHKNILLPNFFFYILQWIKSKRSNRKAILFILYWNINIRAPVLGWIPSLFPSKVELRTYTPPVGVSRRSDRCWILRPHVSGQDPDPGPLGAPDWRCFAHYSIPLTCDSDDVGPKSNMKPFHVNKPYWEEKGSDGYTRNMKTSSGAVTMLLILQLPPIKWPI